MSNAIGSSRESNPSRKICHLRAVPLGHVADIAQTPIPLPTAPLTSPYTQTHFLTHPMHSPTPLPTSSPTVWITGMWRSYHVTMLP